MLNEKNMMNLSFLEKIFNRNDKKLDEICRYLKLDKNILKSFEESYKNFSIDNYSVLGENHLGKDKTSISNSNIEKLKHRIVNELISETMILRYNENRAFSLEYPHLLKESEYVKREEIASITVELRPMLTGSLMKIDLNAQDGLYLLKLLKDFQNKKNSLKRKEIYNRFRQGLDLLDLDEIIYLMPSKNRSSMGYWFPKIVKR